MIIFSNKKYPGYIELFYDLAHKYENKPLFKILRGIPPSKVFFVKAALEEKFKRKFLFKEVKEIIKDKTWQNINPFNSHK